MISSQVNQKVAGVRLADVRSKIADRLRDVQVGDTSVMRVWLSEAQGALGQDATAWDACMAEAKRCDVLVVIYTGSAGWVRAGLGTGICHAEWETGFRTTPQKVRVVRFDGPTIAALKQVPPTGSDADVRFFRALEDAQVWRVDASTVDELIDKVVEAVWWAMTDLVRTGRQAGSRGKNLIGLSLKWANLDFESRQGLMIEAVAAALMGDDKAGHKVDGDGGLLVRPLGGADVAFQMHAVPGPFALPEARASLGQPFRLEVGLLAELDEAKAVGPIHVVAVQQGVTETQVRRFIGRPDALVAAQSFGVFVSDDDSFTQALFLSNCRDPDRVSNAVSQAFQWWGQAGLERTLAQRAAARTAILRALRDFTPRAPQGPAMG
jgi:hypothetical protein